MSDGDRPDIKQLTQLKQLNLNEISKLSWINLSRENFNSLIKDVVDNFDNEDYKNTANNRRYDLKNAEKILLEILTNKISKNEAHKLFSILIKPDVDTLIKSTGRGKNKRVKIYSLFNSLIKPDVDTLIKSTGRGRNKRVNI